MLKLALFRDIGPIIKSGLKRRGDVVKLVFIIALTLSVASLAATQGYTDERLTIRELEFHIGADYRVEFSGVFDHSSKLKALKGVDDVMSLPTLAIEILSTQTVINGVDAANAQFARWHANSFKNTSPEVALDILARDGSIPGVYVGGEIVARIS